MRNVFKKKEKKKEKKKASVKSERHSEMSKYIRASRMNSLLLLYAYSFRQSVLVDLLVMCQMMMNTEQVPTAILHWFAQHKLHTCHKRTSRWYNERMYRMNEIP